MKIQSRYLNCEFEVNTYESADGDTSIQVISHEALENIMHNGLPAELGMRYDYTDMLMSDTHCVIRCTITDNSGRRVQMIGESVPATLETEIARNYPALMSAQRAFDRAAIRYLDFPGKVYSNTEGVRVEESATASVIDVTDSIALEDEAPVESAPINAVAVDTPADDIDDMSIPNAPEDNMVAPEDKPDIPDDIPDDIPVAPNDVPEELDIAPEAPDSSSTAPTPAKPKKENVGSAKDTGSVIVDIGRYRGKKMTVADVYAEDEGYISWICERYNPTTESMKIVTEACKAFLKAQGK